MEGSAAHKLAQKDVDARWVKKTKLIELYEISRAEVHDSQKLEAVVDEKTDGILYADSAYRSEESEKLLKQKKLRNEVHERAYRNKPLTEAQKQRNRAKSRIRSRVEHVFGFMVNTMKADRIRTIGIKRARQQIEISNLVYNFFRGVQLDYDAQAV